MLFIEYPKCSTCQKAKKWLDENGFEYESRHIKDGMLVKRPIIVSDKAILTGFREKEWTERLK